MRRALVATVGLAVMFAAVTLVALEGGEVVVLRTVDDHGAPRETRTWVADESGAAWIEAANADRPFLHQLQAAPDVQLRRSGVWRPCRGTEVANPDGHERIRRLLATKYGWKDCWIGLIADTRDSRAVRLDCP
jgi:hypothetical protein